MSVETQHSDDSGIENYEWFTDENSGSTHYKTDNHHVAITKDGETNFLYLNEYVENVVDSSVYFTDVTYKRNEASSMEPRFLFKYGGQTTLSVDQADVSIEFEELLFEVLINE